MSHLLQEDDEIAEEKNEISGMAEVKKKLGHSSLLKLPAYLDGAYLDGGFGRVGVFEREEEEEEENGRDYLGVVDDKEENSPLARVWLPVEIRGEWEFWNFAKILYFSFKFCGLCFSQNFAPYYCNLDLRMRIKYVCWF